MKSIVEKAKTLFPQINYPIHCTFMDVLSRYYSTGGTYINRADMKKLSQVMGNEFVDLLNLTEDIEKDNNSIEFLDRCLRLKVNAKKRKTDTGDEFSADRNSVEISQAISTYVADFKQQELELKQETERLKALDKEKSAQKMKERSRLIEKQQVEKRAQYLKRYCDFPEFGLNRIKIGSYVAKILIRLKKNDVTEKDYFWLEEKGFINDQVILGFEAFYLKRAKAHLAHWKKSKKPWSLVNAIADYRKSKSSREALGVIESNYPFKFCKGNKQLNSALLTTSGGVYRDLGQHIESLKLGKEANLLAPSDFRPCTLIGASYMLLGDASEGHSWYQKAIERGFKPESYNNELRSIYMRSNQQIRRELKSILLARGAVFLGLQINF